IEPVSGSFAPLVVSFAAEVWLLTGASTVTGVLSATGVSAGVPSAAATATAAVLPGVLPAAIVVSVTVVSVTVVSVTVVSVTAVPGAAAKRVSFFGAATTDCPGAGGSASTT